MGGDGEKVDGVGVTVRSAGVVTVGGAGVTLSGAGGRDGLIVSVDGVAAGCNADGDVTNDCSISLL